MIVPTARRFDQAIRAQARLGARLDATRTQIATGERLTRASDDPAAAATARVLARRATDATHRLSLLDAGQAALGLAEAAFATIEDRTRRAHEIATLSASDTLSDADRATYAAELAGIADDVDRVATAFDARNVRIGATDLPLSPSRADAMTVSAPGGPVDLAMLLRNAAMALTGDAAARDAAIADTAAATRDVATAYGRHGVRAARIDAVRDRLTSERAVATDTRAALTGTDLAAAATMLARDQTALDAVQAAFARTARTTLFDRLG